MTMSAHDIVGKVVLVTGGASGVGAKIVQGCIEEGAKHVAILDIAETAGTALENELNSKYGQRTKFYNCDVTKLEDIEKAFEGVVAEYNYIDIVVNNAGVMNDAIFVKEIQINFLGLVTISLLALKQMRKDEGGKGGAIINVSSVTGLRQGPALPVYFATKSAILQFSNCLGLEENYSQHGVRIITVCFGATETALIKETSTGFIDNNMKAMFDDLLTKIPIQKQESAAFGLIEAYKKGASGSTWLVADDQPPIDYTDRVKTAYKSLFTYNL